MERTSLKNKSKFHWRNIQQKAQKAKELLKVRGEKILGAIIPAVCAVVLIAQPSFGGEKPISKSASDLAPIESVNSAVNKVNETKKPVIFEVDPNWQIKGLSSSISKTTLRRAGYEKQVKAFNVYDNPQTLPLRQDQILGNSQGGIQSNTSVNRVQQFNGLVPNKDNTTTSLVTDTQSNSITTVTIDTAVIDNISIPTNEKFLNFSVQGIITTNNKGVEINTPIFDTPSNSFIVDQNNVIRRSKEDTEISLPTMTAIERDRAMSNKVEDNSYRLNVGGVTKTFTGTPQPSSGQTVVKSNLGINNGRTLTRVGVDPVNANLFTLKQEYRGFNIFTPNQNPLDQNTLSQQTLNTPLSTLANLAGLVPFSPTLLDAKQSAINYERYVIDDKKQPQPFNVPSSTNANNLTGQQAKNLTGVVLSQLTSSSIDNLRDTQTQVNLATGKTDGVSFYIGNNLITNRDIQLESSIAKEMEYTLINQTQTNNQSYINPLVFVNGQKVDLESTQLGFNFLKQNFLGQGTNKKTRIDSISTRQIPTMGLSYASVGLDKKHNPNLIIKTNLALQIDPSSYQVGFLADGSITAKFSENSTVAALVNYRSIVDYNTPNKIELNYNAKLNEKLSISAIGTHYLDNGINNKYFNDINTNTYQLQAIYKPTNQWAASLGYGTNGLTAGIKGSLFHNSVSPSIFFQNSGKESSLNLGLGIKMGQNGTLSINYNKSNSADSYRPSGDSVYIQYSNRKN